MDLYTIMDPRQLPLERINLYIETLLIRYRLLSDLYQLFKTIKRIGKDCSPSLKEDLINTVKKVGLQAHIPLERKQCEDYLNESMSEQEREVFKKRLKITEHDSVIYNTLHEAYLCFNGQPGDEKDLKQDWGRDLEIEVNYRALDKEVDLPTVLKDKYELISKCYSQKFSSAVLGLIVAFGLISDLMINSSERHTVKIVIDDQIKLIIKHENFNLLDGSKIFGSLDAAFILDSEKKQFILSNLIYLAFSVKSKMSSKVKNFIELIESVSTLQFGIKLSAEMYAMFAGKQPIHEEYFSCSALDKADSPSSSLSSSSFSPSSSPDEKSPPSRMEIILRQTSELYKSNDPHKHKKSKNPKSRWEQDKQMMDLDTVLKEGYFKLG